MSNTENMFQSQTVKKAKKSSKEKIGIFSPKKFTVLIVIYKIYLQRIKFEFMQTLSR